MRNRVEVKREKKVKERVEIGRGGELRDGVRERLSQSEKREPRESAESERRKNERTVKGRGGK